MRGATSRLVSFSSDHNISTHTPHAGRDYTLIAPTGIAANFYSHAPCGARPNAADMTYVPAGFLLTRPMRGATPISNNMAVLPEFLLTRPMRGAT